MRIIFSTPMNTLRLRKSWPLYIITDKLGPQKCNSTKDEHVPNYNENRCVKVQSCMMYRCGKDLSTPKSHFMIAVLSGVPLLLLKYRINKEHGY
jgi:hypothetical protein